ncbi:sugar transferase [candidate division KSB1 bacterium]|nr:sugar transferase [candidate division KSB1 bacterium]
MVQWEKALAFRRTHSRLEPIKYFVKKTLLDPIIFVIVSITILIVPKKVLSLLSKERLVATYRKYLIRGLDIVTALSGIVLSLPLWIVLPVLIKVNSPGPVFYKQIRTGVDRRRRDRRGVLIGNGAERRKRERRATDLHGKPFYIIKFRTMTVEAEKESGAVWAKRNDPRVTSIGRWLRKYHIDEIPQLFNVLRGDMSMIGPRPERPEIINRLVEDVPKYHDRLVVKPGVTGPAQIFLGYDSCMEDIKRKIQFDSIYISDKSGRLYLLLLALTAVKIVASMIIVHVGIFNLNITLSEDKKREEYTYSH